MSTGRELISRVKSLSKLVSSDNTLTDRAIFRELKSKASLLIRRETNLRRLWQSPNIFTTVSCLQMEKVPLSECCYYVSDCMVSRSVKEIPQIAEGIFGLLIKSVLSPGMEKLEFSSVERYLNILKLKIKQKKSFYWIHNKRLYTNLPELEAVDVSAYFDDDIDISKLSNCLSTKDIEKTSCVNPLDKEFKIPSYLEDNLVNMVHDTLSKTYYRHNVDITNNNKDEQV